MDKSVIRFYVLNKKLLLLYTVDFNVYIHLKSPILGLFCCLFFWIYIVFFVYNMYFFAKIHTKTHNFFKYTHIAYTFSKVCMYFQAIKKPVFTGLIHSVTRNIHIFHYILHTGLFLYYFLFHTKKKRFADANLSLHT